MKTRVVITGMGWTTPLGDEIDAVWSRLLRGDSGIGPIRRFHASSMSTNFAAETDDPPLETLLADARAHDKALINARFTLAAAARAWRDAGLGDPHEPGFTGASQAGMDSRRVGVYLGAGEGPPDFEAFSHANIAGWQEQTRSIDMARWCAKAYELMRAQREIEQEPCMPLMRLAQTFGACGPCFNCLTACAASTQALGEAAHIIKQGDADLMLAGGAHTMIHPLGVTGFIRLTALSSRCDDPSTACRPFSVDRDGFVMGEGAGVLILESLDHALARGATPLAEIAGFGSSADAFRITDIQPQGEGAQTSMRQALQQAEIDPLAVDDSGRPFIHYISAHGTGTKENDAVETRAIRGVFGDNAPRIPISSIKSMMGHLIAAAGAIEAIACVQTIRTGVAPPTTNLVAPDPECDLDYIPNQRRDLTEQGGVETALSNSFGFGGQNNTLLFRRFIR